jgi:hypothetical protein
VASRMFAPALCALFLGLIATAAGAQRWTKVLLKGTAPSDSATAEFAKTHRCSTRQQFSDSLTIPPQFGAGAGLEMWTDSDSRADVEWVPIAPSFEDSLAGSVVGMLCGATESIVLRADNRMLKFPTSSLPTGFERSDRHLLILARGPSSSLDTIIAYSFSPDTSATRALGTRQAYRVARENAIKAHKWPRAFTSAVVDQKVSIGMTPAMVRFAWGDPDDINKSVYASGTHEQWVYGHRTYVYLVNGRVTSMQGTR